MKKFLIVAILFSAVFAHANEQSLLHAISLLHSGKPDQAAQLMEGIYRNPRSSLQERVSAARMLAFSNSKYLKVQQRQDYAAFVLSNDDKSNAQDRPALLRIAGDGYFQSAKLTKAETFYEELAQSANPLDADYAAYKLGWIDMNLNQQERAFSRWRERLVKGSGHEQYLRKSLVHDMGRAWVETDPAQPSEAEFIKNLTLSASEKAAFIDGILAGLHRVKNIATFRTELFKTEFAPAVMSGLLDRGIGLNERPCSILTWIDQPQRVKEFALASAALLPRLNSCYEHIRSEKDLEGPLQAPLVALYEALDLHGLERLPRSGMYKDLGKSESYCREWMAIEKENFAATGKPLADALLGEASATCGSSAERENFIKYILANPTHFKNTALPLLTASSLTQEERLKLGEAFLNEFGPTPLDLSNANSNVWIETLRQTLARKINSGDFNGAVELLQKYAPLEPRVTERSLELWTLIAASAQPSNPEQSKIAEKVFLARLKMLPRKASAEESTDVLTLANRFNLLKDIWEVWNKLDLDALAKSKLVVDFFQRTYLLVAGDAKGNPADVAALSSAMKKSVLGRALLRTVAVANVALQKPSERNLASLEAAVQALRLPGPGTPKFIQDLRTIQNLYSETQRVEKLKLHADSRLAGKIELGTHTIKKQISLFGESRWSHPSLLNLARLTITQSCDVFSQKIKSIPQPKGITEAQAEQWKAQFDNIASTILTWRNSI